MEIILKQNKPDISDSTIKTYISVLNNLYKKLKIDDLFNVDFFKKYHKEVLKFLETANLNSRKTTISAIITLLGNIKAVEEYRTVLFQDMNIKNKIDNDQKLNDKQKENFLNIDEIKQIYEYYKKKYIGLNIKNLTVKLNKTDYFNYQSFILLSLISGIYTPPRRLMDYIHLKFNDDNENNYLKKGILYFRKYKTQKTYGDQKIKLVPKLNLLLKEYIKYRQINDDNSDYFFINNDNNNMSASNLNQYINSIFENVLQRKINIGVNGLRHIYITDKYKNIPSINDMNDTAYKMGHNVDMALKYIKK